MDGEPKRFHGHLEICERQTEATISLVPGRTGLLFEGCGVPIAVMLDTDDIGARLESIISFVPGWICNIFLDTAPIKVSSSDRMN
jgi:hypothetical protein